jgi:hypothetical protein
MNDDPVVRQVTGQLFMYVGVVLLFAGGIGLLSAALIQQNRDVALIGGMVAWGMASGTMIFYSASRAIASLKAQLAHAQREANAVTRN